MNKGLVAMEWLEEGVRMSDFSDGAHKLGLWLEPGFRVERVVLLNGHSLEGVSLAVGDDDNPGRFGASGSMGG